MSYDSEEKICCLCQEEIIDGDPYEVIDFLGLLCKAHIKCIEKEVNNV